MRRSIKELQSGGFAVVMKLKCELEVVYSLAVASGGAGNRSHRARASLSLGKKLGSNASGGRSWEEIFLIVSTAKNVSGTKYKVDHHLLPSLGTGPLESGSGRQARVEVYQVECIELVMIRSYPLYI